MSRITWAMPRRIAAQIIWMVTLSAVIFHICMSAAFLLARESGLRPPVSHDTMPRLIHALNLIDAAGPAGQAAVMDAVERDRPGPRHRAGDGSGAHYQPRWARKLPRSGTG